LVLIHILSVKVRTEVMKVMTTMWGIEYVELSSTIKLISKINFQNHSETNPIKSAAGQSVTIICSRAVRLYIFFSFLALYSDDTVSNDTHDLFGQKYPILV